MEYSPFHITMGYFLIIKAKGAAIIAYHTSVEREGNLPRGTLDCYLPWGGGEQSATPNISSSSMLSKFTVIFFGKFALKVLLFWERG